MLVIFDNNSIYPYSLHTCHTYLFITVVFFGNLNIRQFFSSSFLPFYSHASIENDNILSPDGHTSHIIRLWLKHVNYESNRFHSDSRQFKIVIDSFKMTYCILFNQKHRKRLEEKCSGAYVCKLYRNSLALTSQQWHQYSRSFKLFRFYILINMIRKMCATNI